MLAIEKSRLDALRQLNLIDTPPSESFDRITRMAGRIFSLPIAAVSLTDSDRQWFKSRIGVEHWEIPRERAPCAQVAVTCRPLIIEDFKSDPFYKDSHLARSGIRFYAGVPLKTKDGHGLGSMCVLGTSPREASQVEIAALNDLAAMVMSEIELRHAFGRIDPISGLPNRTQFFEDLDDLALDQTGARRVAALIDLVGSDHLNHAARVMGPTIVDDMVEGAARVLRCLLGPKTQGYHVGATQFACLLAAEPDASGVLEAFGNKVADLCDLEGDRVFGTPATGFVPFSVGEMAPPDVLRRAQSAAQDARASDKLHSLYSTSQDLAFQRSFTLLGDFKSSITAPDDFRLVYQPRIDMASGSCAGAEALLRWQHPRLGAVPPGEFIPIIEKVPSLATSVTAFVIEAAVGQLARWRAAGTALQVSANISGANLRDPAFATSVNEILARHAVPADALELEITETAVMEDPAQALAQLHALAAAGVRLAIDDFGTGYSSLSYLQRLPVHVVKIDQSFIKDLDTDDRQRSLVQMMVSIGKHLGHRVVAEGVETQGVVERLRGTGCDEMQGYFFARPMPVADFDRWLGARQDRPRRRQTVPRMDSSMVSIDRRASFSAAR